MKVFFSYSGDAESVLKSRFSAQVNGSDTIRSSSIIILELEETNIMSDVSITARPFFEKHGFRIVKKQTVRIGDVELTNYKMEESLCKSK